MARKRGGKSGPRRGDTRPRKQGHERRWNDRSDIPMDEIDEFHASRDKVLLAEDDAQNDSEEEEVFALNGLAESENEEEENYRDNEEHDNGKPAEVSKKTSKSSSSRKKGVEFSSDSSSDSEEEESWGTKKSTYYSSNAAQIESDDEEAHDMEEREALRIQARLHEGLREEDYGVDEALRLSFGPSEENDKDIFDSTPSSNISQVKINDRPSAIRHLQTTSPETLALIQEWDDVVSLIVKSEERMNRPEWLNTKSPATLGLIHMHYQSLLTYASLLAFYFYLRASEKYAQKPESLRTHPITKRLLILKETLTTLQDLDFALSGSEADLSDEDEDLDDFDLSDDVDLGLEEYLLSKARTSNISEIEAALLKSQLEKPSKKVEKPSKKKKPVSSKTDTKIVFDVEEPTLAKSQQSNKVDIFTADGFGEATALDLADAVDKNVRKKALRFHTMKIDNASARRANARSAIGGDDDIPYRERRKQQQARAFEEAKRSSTLGQGGDDLDDVDPEVESSSRKRSRDEQGSNDDSSDDDDVEGYYSLIKRRKSKEKADKKARYEEEKAANAIDYNEEDADGQRSISRAILKNKGLTPKRSKTVRNPRVKKRQRFEKAKKKLASQKAVYKGPGDASRYDGERSGISKVVKSVKL